MPRPRSPRVERRRPAPPVRSHGAAQTAARRTARRPRTLRRAILLVALAFAVWAHQPAPAQAQGDADPLTEIRKLAAQERYEAALSRLDAHIESHPQESEPRLLKGVLLKRAGRLEEAVRAFRELTRDQPELPEAWNNLAVMYAEQGRYDEAYDALLKAIELEPRYATAHENLGDLHAQLAALSYRRAHRLDESNERARRKLDALSELIGIDDLAQPDGAPVKPEERDGDGGSEDPARTTATPPGTCYRVAGLAESEARSMAERLQARNATVRVRPDTAGGAERYMVYLPPLESRDAAEVEVQRLRENGIRDLFLIPRGERENGIALGVYSRLANAEERRAQLGRLGFEARVAPLGSDVSWVVEVAAPTGAGIDAALLRRHFPAHEPERVDCP